LTARCAMYAQKALNLNKGVKLCLSKIVGIILLLLLLFHSNDLSTKHTKATYHT
jgi:hypothetical protein